MYVEISEIVRMPPKQTKKRQRSPSKSPKTSAALPSAGYLLTCDAPTKQFIKSLNDKKSVDKQFVIEDLDPTHLLIKGRAREEISIEVEKWMDSVSLVSRVEFIRYLH